MRKKNKAEFDPYNVPPYDDLDEIKKRAEEYIFRIKYGVDFFGRYNYGVKPTVFMSMDIMSVIYRACDQIQCFYPGNKYLICGCPLKVTTGEDELYIGFNLLETGQISNEALEKRKNKLFSNYADGEPEFRYDITHWMPLPEPPKMRKEDEEK